ncbi:MAG: hypothetical protein QM765_10660 [Myxococcales bacterium]
MMRAPNSLPAKGEEATRAAASHSWGPSTASEPVLLPRSRILAGEELEALLGGVALLVDGELDVVGAGVRLGGVARRQAHVEHQVVAVGHRLARRRQVVVVDEQRVGLDAHVVDGDLDVAAALAVLGVDRAGPAALDVLGGRSVDLRVEPALLADEPRLAGARPVADLLVRRQEIEQRELAQALLGHQVVLVLDLDDREVVDALRVQEGQLSGGVDDGVVAAVGEQLAVDPDPLAAGQDVLLGERVDVLARAGDEVAQRGAAAQAALDGGGDDRLGALGRGAGMHALQEQRALQALLDGAVLELVLEADLAQHVVGVAQVLDLVLEVADAVGLELAVVEAGVGVQGAALLEAVAGAEADDAGVEALVGQLLLALRAVLLAADQRALHGEVDGVLGVEGAEDAPAALLARLLGDLAAALAPELAGDVEHPRAVGEEHGVQAAGEERAHRPLALPQAVGLGVALHGAVELVVLDDLLVGGDEQVVGEGLDADHRLALQRRLLREGDEGVRGVDVVHQPVLGAQPDRVAVEHERADLLAADGLEREVGDDAGLGPDAREADVGADPDVVAQLVELEEVVAHQAVGHAEAAQPVDVGVVEGDAGAGGEPDLAADGQRVVDGLVGQALGVGVDAEGAVVLAVARQALVGGEPDVLVVVGDGGDGLAGQPVVHGQAGGGAAARVEADGAVVGGDPQRLVVDHQLVHRGAAGEDAPAVLGLVDEDLARADPDAFDGVDGDGRVAGQGRGGDEEDQERGRDSQRDAEARALIRRPRAGAARGVAQKRLAHAGDLADAGLRGTAPAQGRRSGAGPRSGLRFEGKRSAEPESGWSSVGSD